jgi:hypothetical protein
MVRSDAEKPRYFGIYGVAEGVNVIFLYIRRVAYGTYMGSYYLYGPMKGTTKTKRIDQLHSESDQCDLWDQPTSILGTT